MKHKKIIKIFTLLFVFIAGITAKLTIASATTKPTVKVGEIENAKVGKIVEVPISIENPSQESYATIGIGLKYDASKLEYNTSFIAEEIKNDDWTILTTNDVDEDGITPGEMALGNVGLLIKNSRELNYKSATIVKVSFKVLDGAIGKQDIKITKLEVAGALTSGEDLKYIDVNHEDGYINIPALNGLNYNKLTKKWEYYSNGIIDSNYNGLASNENGTFYVNNGIITFKHNELMYYKGKWTAIVNSKVTPTYTGLSTNKNGTYYLEKGVLSFKYNGTYKDSTGNVYVLKNSKVDTSFTGLKNVSGTWYYFKKGKTDYTYTGYATNNNGTYYVEKGKITFNFNILAMYNGKWTAIVKSKVQPTYTGISTNKNGTYYLKNGEVQFGFSGKITLNGKTYTIVKGKVKM